jgi:hypothetical protein
VRRVQATARSFLMVLALLLNGNSFKHNHAADQVTFFAILLASAAVDAISPLLGSLRAFCGVFLGEFFFFWTHAVCTSSSAVFFFCAH